MRCSEQGAQQNPDCWDPIHADHVSMGPHPCRPCATAPPDALPPAAPSFSVSLGCPKGSKIPQALLCYRFFMHRRTAWGLLRSLSFFFPLKRSLSPGLHQFIPHFQSSENPSHMKIQVTECTSHTPEDGQGSSSCAGT